MCHSRRTGNRKPHIENHIISSSPTNTCSLFIHTDSNTKTDLTSQHLPQHHSFDINSHTTRENPCRNNSRRVSNTLNSDYSDFQTWPWFPARMEYNNYWQMGPIYNWYGYLIKFIKTPPTSYIKTIHFSSTLQEEITSFLQKRARIPVPPSLINEGFYSR